MAHLGQAQRGSSVLHLSHPPRRQAKAASSGEGEGSREQAQEWKDFMFLRTSYWPHQVTWLNPKSEQKAHFGHSGVKASYLAQPNTDGAGRCIPLNEEGSDGAHLSIRVTSTSSLLAWSLLTVVCVCVCVRMVSCFKHRRDLRTSLSNSLLLQLT